MQVQVINANNVVSYFERNDFYLDGSLIVEFIDFTTVNVEIGGDTSHHILDAVELVGNIDPQINRNISIH